MEKIVAPLRLPHGRHSQARRGLWTLPPLWTALRPAHSGLDNPAVTPRTSPISQPAGLPTVPTALMMTYRSWIPWDGPRKASGRLRKLA